MTSGSDRYLLLRKIYEGTLFRYGIAAGSGFTADQLVYLASYYWLLKGHNLNLFGYMITPRFPSLIMSFSAGLVVNFSISKYYVFRDSYLKGTTQLGRFMLVTVFIFILNYLFMRVLDDQVHLEAGVSRFVAGASISIVSYFSHKMYTFRVREEIKEA
ncbi:MAG: GtrA family protein [Sphingobacteriia bacterium]|jgi:putative flippase GtrA|nr:GtrA family protein [Sphingobacteriia bacterium]